MAAKVALPAAWEIPQEFRDRLGTTVGRQRVMSAEGHLLLVLHAPPKPGEDERRGRFFWLAPDGTWTSNLLGSGPGAMTKHLNEFEDCIESYSTQEIKATSAEDYFTVLDGLAPLRHAVRHLYDVLQETRDMRPEVREIINYRDRAYKIERTADLLYSGAKNSLDYTMARRSEEQAQSSHQMAVSAHRLNVLAAFFFPIATLSAVFGVNLLHGFEEIPPPVPFVAMLATGLVVGALITVFVGRKKKV